GHALAGGRFGVELAELALEQAVDAADFLFFTQLHAVARQARLLLAVLAGRIGAMIDRTLFGIAFLALEEELLALAAALPALGIEISGHGCSLNASLFRRTAAVVRHRCHIRNAGDLETHCIEGAHRRLAAGAGALDAHFEVLHPAFDRELAALFSG